MLNKKITILMIVLGMGWLGPEVWANDCKGANEIYKQVSSRNPDPSVMPKLEEAVALCPKHWKALNDLGYLYEQKGDFKKAEHFYSRAAQANPKALHPLAGLGDVALEKGDFPRAVKFYTLFLDGLNRLGSDNETLAELQCYKADYQNKLQDAMMRANILQKSLNDTRVGSDYIVRGLIAPATRGPGGTRKRVRLALKILFEYDSANLTEQGKAQVNEVAKALKSPELSGANILIIGHTDSFGSEDYNIKLSLRRAEAVTRLLVKSGIEAVRLKADGRGEENLLVKKGSKQAQSINRRVEFINENGPLQEAGYLKLP